MALRILTDSACDIDLSLQDSLDLKILPLKVFFGEKKLCGRGEPDQGRVLPDVGRFARAAQDRADQSHGF